MVQGGNVIEARELLREIVVIVRYNPTRICSLQGSSLRNFRYLGLEAVDLWWRGAASSFIARTPSASPQFRRASCGRRDTLCSRLHQGAQRRCRSSGVQTIDESPPA